MTEQVRILYLFHQLGAYDGNLTVSQIVANPTSQFVRKSCEHYFQNISRIQPLLTITTATFLAQATTSFCLDYNCSLLNEPHVSTLALFTWLSKLSGQHDPVKKSDNVSSLWKTLQWLPFLPMRSFRTWPPAISLGSSPTALLLGLLQTRWPPRYLSAMPSTVSPHAHCNFGAPLPGMLPHPQHPPWP